MAKLAFENHTTTTSMEEIQEALKPLNVSLQPRAIAEEKEAQQLLQAPTLQDAEKNQLLAAHDDHFQELKKEQGYQDRDLIVLHPDLEGLDQLLSQFDKCHTHDDDEVRFIIDGEGEFGFSRPDGSQVLLTVEAGDLINVPKDTPHWFRLTSSKRIKAIRYFTGKDGWVAKYTETETRL